MIGAGLLVLMLLVAVYGATGWFPFLDSGGSGSFLSISRLDDQPPPRLNASTLHERAPELAGILDAMIENDDKRRNLPLTEERQSWCPRADPESRSCPVRFTYRDIGFRLGTIMS